MTSTPAHPGTAQAAPDATHESFDGEAFNSSALVRAGDEGLEGVDTADHGHPDPRLSGEAPVSGPQPVRILLYSDDVDTRGQVRMAIGRRVAADLPPVEWTEVATPPAVISAVDRSAFDLLILDGESAPAGGLGVCKQLKDEKYECPPILVLTGRPQDAWLATWSRADAAVPHPLDPRVLAEAVAALARRARG
jgi:CheY-like chemotaxis protein